MPKKSYIQLGEELAAFDGQGSFFAFAEKLGVTRTAAYRLIRSAEVARQVEQAGFPVPQKESQARILHELLSDPDQRISAWKAAIEEGKSRRLTAAVVRDSVAKIQIEEKVKELAAVERAAKEKAAERVREEEAIAAKIRERVKTEIEAGKVHPDDAADYIERLERNAGLHLGKPRIRR